LELHIHGNNWLLLHPNPQLLWDLLHDGKNSLQERQRTPNQVDSKNVLHLGLPVFLHPFGNCNSSTNEFCSYRRLRDSRRVNQQSNIFSIIYQELERHFK